VTFQLPVSLIEKARDVVFFSPGLHYGQLPGTGARCSVEAGGEKARQAFSVACRSHSQDWKADKGCLNPPAQGRRRIKRAAAGLPFANPP
jgi:hypothetical protein